MSNVVNHVELFTPYGSFGFPLRIKKRGEKKEALMPNVCLILPRRIISPPYSSYGAPRYGREDAGYRGTASIAQSFPAS